MTITAIRPEAVAGGHTPAAPAPAIDFDELVREHRRKLVWAAYHRTEENWHDAEDAVQDALLKAWEKRDTFTARDGAPAIAWVASLAKYRAYQVIAGRGRYVPAGEWVERFAEEQEDRPTDTGLPCMADPETCAKVYAALIPLPDQQRLAVQMYCLQGMPRRTIAECMRVAPEEVTTLTAAGIGKLTRRHAPEPVDVPTRQRQRVYPRRDQEMVALFTERPDLVERLPPRQREAVRLRYVEGLTTNQAAVRMGVVYAAIVSYVRAASRNMRILISGAVFTPKGRAAAVQKMEGIADDGRFVASLSERHQEFVRLRLVDGLEPDVVARRLGCTKQAVQDIQKKVVKHWRAWTAVRSNEFPVVVSS